MINEFNEINIHKKNDDHNINMENTYADIYKDFYDFSSDKLDEVRNKIKNNLIDLELNDEDFKRSNVLNIGPAREVYIFQELGFNNVYHVDVSDIAVKAVNNLKEQKHCTNIFSFKNDICSSNKLKFNHKIDLVYLSGVFHHLHDPKKAVKNIMEKLNTKARIYLRIYRSGSLNFFIVDFIRKYVMWEDKKNIEIIFKKKYLDLDTSSVLFKDMIDNFFVPISRYYDPAELNEYFAMFGLSSINNNLYEEYNHENTELSGQGWSLHYITDNIRLLDDLDNLEFPKHIDQMNDVHYKEEFILETVRLMKQFLINSKNYDRQFIIEILLDLYKLCQIKGSIKKINSENMHKKIQNTMLNSNVV